VGGARRTGTQIEEGEPDVDVDARPPRLATDWEAILGRLHRTATFSISRSLRFFLAGRPWPMCATRGSGRDRRPRRRWLCVFPRLVRRTNAVGLPGSPRVLSCHVEGGACEVKAAAGRVGSPGPPPDDFTPIARRTFLVPRQYDGFRTLPADERISLIPALQRCGSSALPPGGDRGCRHTDWGRPRRRDRFVFVRVFEARR